MRLSRQCSAWPGGKVRELVRSFHLANVLTREATRTSILFLHGRRLL